MTRGERRLAIAGVVLMVVGALPVLFSGDPRSVAGGLGIALAGMVCVCIAGESKTR